MTVREALAEGADALERAGCPSPAVDAEWLLAHVLGRQPKPRCTPAGGTSRLLELDSYRGLVARRASREPLAYILGEWGFRRLTLVVDRRVLIPRPETESVVERCLAILDGVEEPTVLDIGAGSGAIALAIADEHPGARVVGDRRLGVRARGRGGEPAPRRRGRPRAVRPRRPARGRAGPFDLVVSNPPYVAPDELAALEPELHSGAAGGARRRGRTTKQWLGRRWRRSARAERSCSRWATLRPRRSADLLAELGFPEVVVSADLAGRERVVDGRRP